MAQRIAISTLNAKTIDILNTIRANASSEYQSLVPTVSTEQDIPRVGEVLYGYPAMANQFLSALINRIAYVRVKSSTFNNKFAPLKKGYLEFGETVEEVFVELAKAREFSAEKAEDREFKRTIPDVRSAFHVMNYRVQYPITVQQEDLKRAFTSANGVTDLISRIIDSVYQAAEYDEYLLFKYLIIKAVAHGKMYAVAFDSTDMKNAAKSFRGVSNKLEFISTKYNATGVHTNTDRGSQYIFMDTQYNADYDVDVLASAFNMDKATFMGHLQLVDDWTTFDNERFDVIRANSTQLEEVTSGELALMSDVKAVLVDEEWFQVYDNNMIMTEQQVASGLYWNYFLNVWKTVSFSPFSNAIVFVDDGATTTLADVYDGTITGKSVSDEATILTLDLSVSGATLVAGQYNFIQTEDCTEDGVAVHKYGAIIYPANADDQILEVQIGDTVYTSCTISGSSPSYTYTASAVDYSEADVGDVVKFCKKSLTA